MGDASFYSNKELLIISGPTAVGKTSFAIRTALEYQTEIISCDSRQMYRELKIGTAPPSAEELQTVPHHFIGNLSIHDYYNVSRFEEDALVLVDRLFEKHNIVVMCGGSGLYIHAFRYGIDQLPTIDPQIRDQIQETYRREGLEYLRRELKMIDPAYYENADLHNTQRIIRAIETYYQTGKPHSSFLTAQYAERPFHIRCLALTRPREVLYDRINQRVDEMIKQGLVEEARSLYPFRNLNALNTVGYKELFEYFDQKCDLETAIFNIKSHTRRYARRQLTWLRREPDITWQELP